MSPLGPAVIVVSGGDVSGMSSNSALTARFALIVTVQVAVPEQAPPQRAKLEPGAGVALSVTCSPRVASDSRTRS